MSILCNLRLEEHIKLYDELSPLFLQIKKKSEQQLEIIDKIYKTIGLKRGQNPSPSINTSRLINSVTFIETSLLSCPFDYVSGCIKDVGDAARVIKDISQAKTMSNKFSLKCERPRTRMDGIMDYIAHIKYTVKQASTHLQSIKEILDESCKSFDYLRRNCTTELFIFNVGIDLQEILIKTKQIDRLLSIFTEKVKKTTSKFIINNAFQSSNNKPNVLPNYFSGCDALNM